MSVVRALPVSLLVAFVAACPVGDFASLSGDDELVPCVDDVDAGVDAGFCDPSELGTALPEDGGPGGENDRGIACATLRASACGQNDECLEDPGCVAADLVARFEPERCASAVGDARSFPPCALGNCVLLTERVCGPGDAVGVCEDAPACAPARELARRADEGDTSADDACAQALADEALFPSCA